MLFNSWQFVFLFLPITVFVFFKIGSKNNQVAIAWLIAASLFFYSWWNPAYLGLLIFSIIFNYRIGKAINQPIHPSITPKIILTFGVAVNLFLIGYFKYANFFASNVNQVLGTNIYLNKLVLPLAISFFTFEQIAYLVDVYKGEAKADSFLTYSLFVSFFPRLIAGPIIRYQDVMPQFADRSIYKFNIENLAIGITIFLIGLGKKVLIADQIANYGDLVFDTAALGLPLTFYEAWSGAVIYSLQLYFDFSGYSDMAIGIARIFGSKIPLNFDSPYKAVNIIDFWRRWHITLSNFLRDYLYIPLGGNRQGKAKRNVNLLITMLLGGLWHGAGWTFIIWGGLHGLYLIINHQWRSLRKLLGHDLKKSYWWTRILSCFLTFIAVVIAWVFFRAENINVALAILETMSGSKGISLASPTIPSTKTLTLILLITIWFTPNTQQFLMQHQPALTEPIATSSKWGNRLLQKLQWQPTKSLGIVLGILAFAAIKTLLAAPHSKFLYFNF
ncbi:MAG: MBOAT family protein [Coleofasciculaceae cyanobacterium]